MKVYQGSILLALATVLAMIIKCEGRQLSRCELARELKNLGFSDLGNWVCLVEAESSRRTSARNLNGNRNGSGDWGLFQINDRYWCRRGARGGDCNVDCYQLVNDNIRDDAMCAKIVFRRHDFNAWEGWKSKCRGQDVSQYIKNCGV